MTATESMHSLLNLKYVVKFNFIEDAVFMIKKPSYTRLVYFQNGIR